MLLLWIWVQIRPTCSCSPLLFVSFSSWSFLHHLNTLQNIKIYFSSTGIMKAVIIKQPGKPIVANIKEPSLKPDYIKVKTVAVASNPSELFPASLRVTSHANHKQSGFSSCVRFCSKRSFARSRLLWHIRRNRGRMQELGFEKGRSSFWSLSWR